MRTRLFFVASFFIFSATISFAQLVAPNVFLQGHWLEIGVDNMGAFGTCTSPTTYHACDGAGTFTPGVALAEVYDWGHDGWSTGTPPLMGDYTEPGVPSEGWSVQVAGTEYDNWVYGGLCSGSFGIPGTVTCNFKCYGI